MFTTVLALTGMLSGLGALALGWYVLSRVREVDSESQVVANRAAEVTASGVDPLAVRDVAVLHYDALEEMSGARSFSLALLNSGGDGVVVTSINGRTESRTYAKPVVGGDSDVLLSPEEYRVVRSARLGEGVGATVTAGSSGSGSRRADEEAGGGALGNEHGPDPDSGSAGTARESKVAPEPETAPTTSPRSATAPEPETARGTRTPREGQGTGMVSVLRDAERTVGQGVRKTPE